MQVTATADGVSEAINLGQGEFYLQIVADTWGGSTSVALQEGSGATSTFVASDDPYNTGNAIARTANGKMLLVRGGISYRLNVTSYSGSANLRLVAHRAN